jgi:hypothetical protein
MERSKPFSTLVGPKRFTIERADKRYGCEAISNLRLQKRIRAVAQGRPAKDGKK